MKPLVFDLSTQGLDPLRHRIIGITTKSSTEEKIFTDRDEKKLLVAFWQYVKANNFTRLIGFNSDQFDVPMLKLRSLKYNIATDNIKEKTLDLRKVIFKGINYPKGKLTDFAEMLGLKYEDHGYKKMHMSILWEAPHLTNLRSTLLQDVKTTYALFSRSRECGLV